MSPVAIGTTDPPAARFALINAAAAATWALVFVSAGYGFGQGIEAVFGRLKSEHGLLLGLAVGAILAAGLAVWTRRRWRPGTAGRNPAIEPVPSERDGARAPGPDAGDRQAGDA